MKKKANSWKVNFFTCFKALHDRANESFLLSSGIIGLYKGTSTTMLHSSLRNWYSRNDNLH
jgi:hypothetical protein